MDRILPLLCSLLLVAAVCHAALPSEVYWHSVLPNTPMPASISDLLDHDEFVDEKTGTHVNVGKGGVNVHTGYGKPGGTTVGVGRGGVHVNAPGTTVGVGRGGVHVSAPGTTVGTGRGGVHINAPGTTVGVGRGGVHVGAGKGKPGSTGVNVGPGGVGVNVRPKNGKPPVIVHVGNSPFNYNYAATETQLHDDPRVALFFSEQDLHPGTEMTLQFTKTNTGAKFLSKSEADSIPFSSEKLPEILDLFSVKPGSEEAEAMKETLQECEGPTVKGEKKVCATSLESMVDFSVSSLGTRDIKAAATTVYGKDETPRQEYTFVASGVKKIAGDEHVACHAEAYAYAVFYCHVAKSTRAYTVKMAGKDGTIVDALAVCHTDTSAWNPNHIAFKVLKVKPGTEPVCHFLPQDHLVWSRSG